MRQIEGRLDDGLLDSFTPFGRAIGDHQHRFEPAAVVRDDRVLNASASMVPPLGWVCWNFSVTSLALFTCSNLR